MALYTDFDLKLTQNPFTKDISRLEDYEAVKIAIRNIVMTNRFERRFNPMFGGNIRNFVFENMDVLSLETIKDDIISKIIRNEPRITELKITSFIQKENSISLKLQYRIKEDSIPGTIDVIIYRNR